jgi:hypothetical protein
MSPRRVVIESPYHADSPEGIEANLEYCRSCIRDSLLRGEAPLASHLIYPLVFDDNVQTERVMGIKAGLAWGAAADATVIYTDRGISTGMQIAIDDAVRAGRPVEHRKLSEAARVGPVIAARRHLAEIKAQRGPDAGVRSRGFSRWRGS